MQVKYKNVWDSVPLSVLHFCSLMNFLWSAACSSWREAYVDGTKPPDDPGTT